MPRRPGAFAVPRQKEQQGQAKSPSVTVRAHPGGCDATTKKLRRRYRSLRQEARAHVPGAQCARERVFLSDQLPDRHSSERVHRTVPEVRRDRRRGRGRRPDSPRPPGRPRARGIGTAGTRAPPPGRCRSTPSQEQQHVPAARAHASGAPACAERVSTIEHHEERRHGDQHLAVDRVPSECPRRTGDVSPQRRNTMHAHDPRRRGSTRKSSQTLSRCVSSTVREELAQAEEPRGGVEDQVANHEIVPGERAQHEAQEAVVANAEQAHEVVRVEEGPRDGKVDARGEEHRHQGGNQAPARRPGLHRRYAPQLLTSTPSALMPPITRDGTSDTGSQS